ncbi:MAG: methyltransferase domain-containing protein [Elusimicrobiota bacterium]
MKKDKTGKIKSGKDWFLHISGILLGVLLFLTIIFFVVAFFSHFFNDVNGVVKEIGIHRDIEGNYHIAKLDTGQEFNIEFIEEFFKVEDNVRKEMFSFVYYVNGKRCNIFPRFLFKPLTKIVIVIITICVVMAIIVILYNKLFASRPGTYKRIFKKAKVKSKNNILIFNDKSPEGYLVAASNCVGNSGMVYIAIINPDLEKEVERIQNIISKRTLLNVKVIYYDDKIYLNDNSINVAMCYGTLHRINDRNRFLEEVNRVLKPDGIFHLSYSQEAEHKEDYVETTISKLETGRLFRILYSEGTVYTLVKPEYKDIEVEHPKTLLEKLLKYYTNIEYKTSVIKNSCKVKINKESPDETDIVIPNCDLSLERNTFIFGFIIFWGILCLVGISLILVFGLLDFIIEGDTRFTEGLFLVIAFWLPIQIFLFVYAAQAIDSQKISINKIRNKVVYYGSSSLEIFGIPLKPSSYRESKVEDVRIKLTKPSFFDTKGHLYLFMNDKKIKVGENRPEKRL